MIFKKKSTLVVVILLCNFLIACQPRITKHGNFIDINNLDLIKKSKLNKSEVLEIFGEPTTKSTFSDNVWYYITLTQYEKAYFEIKNTENKILIISFDNNQIVKKYSLLTERDATEITISARKKGSNSQDDITLIQEFFSIFSRKLDAP
tara:strand:- start:490 stop:936 length:447 start_codon:yes stop_codon:yes gene_type:complete